MNTELLILILEAMAVYFLVLWTHSLRHRFGLAHFYALLGAMQGTLVSRFVISVFASPFLYLYLAWQNRRRGVEIEKRPVLAILKEVAEVRAELTLAQCETVHNSSIRT